MVFSFQFFSIYLCLELTNNINRKYISTMGKISNSTNKNKGFTLVEVLLLIVVLILVGGLGYLGFKQVNKKSKTSTTSTTATTTKTTTPTTTAAITTLNQNVIKIPELGIKITVPDSLKDLTYSTETQDGYVYARFSTTSLTRLDSNCSDSHGSLGVLLKGNGQYVSAPGQAGLVKQFATFYITGGGPQSGCSMNNADANALQQQQTAVLVSAYPSVTLLP